MNKYIYIMSILTIFTILLTINADDYIYFKMRCIKQYFERKVENEN